MFEDLKNRLGVSPDLKVPAFDPKAFTPAEIEEMRAFLGERHPAEEWDAFFKFWSLSPRMRAVSRFSGTILSMLGF